MSEASRWNGQNIPRVHQGRVPGEGPFAILPVMEFLLQYDPDTVDDLLAPAESYGWQEELMNELAWANNYHRITYLEPDFESYGWLPRWFPKNDREGRLLSQQGRVDRFLYLLDLAFGGLPDDHNDANARQVAAAILELHDDLGTYVGIEEHEGKEWELEGGPQKRENPREGPHPAH